MNCITAVLGWVGVEWAPLSLDWVLAQASATPWLTWRTGVTQRSQIQIQIQIQIQALSTGIYSLPYKHLKMDVKPSPEE